MRWCDFCTIITLYVRVPFGTGIRRTAATAVTHDSGAAGSRACGVGDRRSVSAEHLSTAPGLHRNQLVQYGSSTYAARAILLHTGT